jgi:hypothetical protein
MLPLLYTRWADEFLGGPIPAETEATCAQCALLAVSPTPAKQNLTRRIYPRTKCCTYYPELTNFQVGFILNENDPNAAPARAVVLARVQAQFMATPLNLLPPLTQRLLYSKAPYMGSALSLCCPYYVEELLGGACGIWQHRNAVCMTWHCKHVRGQVSQSFWIDALKPLFKTLEHTLAYWCLTQLDLPEANLASVLAATTVNITDPYFTPDMLDETVDPKAHRMLWGPWTGREAEFYSECARRVAALTPQEVLAIGGPLAALRLRLARQAYGKLIAAKLPHTVHPGHFTVQPLADGEVQIVSYDANDPLVLPLEVLNLLPYFIGRSVTEALQVISDEAQIDMEPALVRKLLDFEILVEAEPE